MDRAIVSTPTVDAGRVAERIAGIRQMIDTHATRPVTLVAVTKRFGPDAVTAALDNGVADIGLNYAQELLATRDAVAQERPDASVRWHMIGHVQRNKVKTLAGVVSLWQTVDSLKLGAEIAKRDPGAKVLAQVNLAATTSQSGVAEADVPDLVDGLRDLDLDLRGLMMIGSAGDADATDRLFRRLRAMADDLELPECSMGMSGDLELALAAGATIVRVGTAIFGPRPT